jgi:isopentenyl phosphate kinase
MVESRANLTFLKLGGSLITDKSLPGTPRRTMLARLSAEIAHALARAPEMRLVLGHGSGSFGHTAAHEHSTRLGVRTPEQWRGFAKVWRQAAALHHLVIEHLHEVGLAAISFPPSAAAVAQAGRIISWDLEAMAAALEAGLVPVVYGDVAFDSQIGGTILSTEDLFGYLARRLGPKRILLAGIEPGVWADYPERIHLVPEITPGSLPGLTAVLQGARDKDVTGGMASKVQLMMRLVQEVPGLEAVVFGGEPPGSISRALAGERLGTLIRPS